MDTLENPGDISERIYWGPGQPDEGEPGDRQLCTSATFTGPAETREQETPEPQRWDYTPVSLTDCDAVRLPYVCVTEQLLRLNLQIMSSCPRGYYGSPWLQQCYKEQGLATFEDADNVCTQDGGRLARVDSIFHHNVVSRATTQLMMGITEEVESPVSGPTWVGAGSSCNVIDRQWSSMSYHWNCDSRLPGLCETPAVYEEKIGITASVLTELTTRPIGKSGDLEVFLPKESRFREVARLNCNFKGYNPEKHGVTWYRNGTALPVVMYSTSRDGVHLNVSLGLRDAPITLVGYYWCETFNRNATRLERSNNIFLRYIDEDLHAGSIELQQTGLIPPSTYNMFNLAGVVTFDIDKIVKAYNSTPRNIFPVFIHPLRFR
ncbi:uncharacterized protein LOC124278191 [Haliotis rubra]|nr:uncharacterized protein LOC124278191 [Haliotis rubra]